MHLTLLSIICFLDENVKTKTNSFGSFVIYPGCSFGLLDFLLRESSEDSLEEAVDGLGNLHGEQYGALLLQDGSSSGWSGLGALLVQEVLLEQLLLLGQVAEEELLNGGLLLLELAESIGRHLQGVTHVSVGGLDHILNIDAACLALGKLRGRNQERQSGQVDGQKDIGVRFVQAALVGLLSQGVGNEVESRLLRLLLLLGAGFRESSEFSVVLVLNALLVSRSRRLPLALVNVERIREQHQAETHYLGEVREGIRQEGERLGLLVDVGVVGHVARCGFRQVDVGGLLFLEGIGQEGEREARLLLVIVIVVVNVVGHIGSCGIGDGDDFHLRIRPELVV